jgi:UDP-GlcNAc:undecaprenyl-phosphate/decaprenyl-phosphate GlcNAc-1-phosphate transferase
MNTYLMIFVIATISSLVLTPIVRRVCEFNGWLDIPSDERRIHSKSIPRLGGLAIYGSVVISLSALFFVDNMLTQFLKWNSSQIWAVSLSSTLVFLFGIYDDLCGAKATIKFALQGMAAALVFFMGGHIEFLSIPFIGGVELSTTASFLLTVLWIVAITNAFNLIDGMDGLAAGAALFASLVIMVVSLMLERPLVTVTMLALCGALIGFLRYNFNPASIFLGDSGSLFIGFTLAVLSLQSAQKASTAVAVAIPLIAFALPVTDTLVAILRRFISGSPLFQGDREHIHHMLLARGWSQRRVVIVLYGVCAVFGLLALLFVNVDGGAGRTTGLALFVVGVAVIFGVGRLQYHEVDEIKASMKRNIAERRIRVANNIRVRRLCRLISKASTLEELFKAMQEILDLGEFVYIKVHLECNRIETKDALPIARSISEEVFKAEINDNSISWSYGRSNVESSIISESGRCWVLHLPLATKRARWGYINLYREYSDNTLLLDINYVCNLFQQEMTLATERVLGEKQILSSPLPSFSMKATVGN